METKRNLLKKLSGIMLAAMLLVGMVFTYNTNEAFAASEVAVNVTVQHQNQFTMLNKQEKVRPGLAKEYGYTNDASIGENEVSGLDALVAAHIDYYGTAFTKETASQYLAVSSTGWISKTFGKTDSLSFVVNGQVPCLAGSNYGAMLTQVKLNADDQIDFFYYQDLTAYADLFTWFEQSGKKVESLKVKEGEKIALNLAGFSVCYYDNSKGIEKQAVSKAQVTTVDAKGTQSVLTDKVTNDKGEVSISFAKAGTYLVSAQPTEGSVKFTSPCLKVVVEKEKYVTLKNPTKKGYVFKGWYKEASFKTKVTKVKESEYNKVKLYQKWEKVTVKKVTSVKAKNNKKKAVKVSWKKLSKANGYQVIYSTNKKFKKSNKTKTVKATSLQLNKLSKNKTYYVKVRAYRTDSKNKKVYGSYSKVVKVKIKK
ncbi:uncharacterized protein containing predicted phosphatase domain [Lachnospiraceae bacterium KM106-2]|nr:uncharacterized protein containing predicted phosphatase domain [Lachnospiraceae bacterium KM106-2]